MIQGFQSFFLVLAIGIGFLGTLLAWHVYLAIRSKLNLRFYQRQGMKTHFSFFSGYYELFSKDHSENSKNSNLEYVKQLAKEHRKEGAVACNIRSRTNAYILIFDAVLIKDFVLQEEHFEKQMMVKLRPDVNFFGLFHQNGQEALNSRALFSKIFKYEGILSFVPQICLVIQHHFEEFNKEHGIEKGKALKINLDDLFRPIRRSITSLIIFGKPSLDHDSVEAELYDLMLRLFEANEKAKTSLLAKVAPDLSMKYLLTRESAEMYRLNKRQEEIFKRIFSENSTSTYKEDSIIERMLIHNKQVKDRQVSQEELLTPLDAAGHYNIFAFAGSDAAQNVIKMALCYMADKPHLKSFIDQINLEIFDASGKVLPDLIETNEKLELWTKEALRIHHPAPRLNARRATKDLKLGQFTIRKGDLVSILTPGLHYDENSFSDPETFKTDRFAKEKEKELKRNQYIPFSVGNRNCMGRNLGKLMVKIIITLFFRTYHLERPEGHEYYRDLKATAFCSNPVVEVSLK